MIYIPAAETKDGVARVIYEAKDGKGSKTFTALDWLAQGSAWINIGLTPITENSCNCSRQKQIPGIYRVPVRQIAVIELRHEDLPGRVTITEDEVIVRFARKAHNPFLIAAGFAEEKVHVP